MKIMKKFLLLIIWIVLALSIAVLDVMFFTVMVVKMNVWFACILSIIFYFLSMLGLNFLWKKKSSVSSSNINLKTILATIIFGLLMLYVFIVPTETYKSTNSVVPQYGVTPNLIDTSTGEKVAVYVQRSKIVGSSKSILFINGGPGFAPGPSVREYLEGYTKLGYTVYAFDSIGNRCSPEPKTVDVYTIENEVKIINDIVSHYKIDKVNLIAHSYGGNVAARFIEKHPNKVNAYLALDTAPLYSMDENYRGQAQDQNSEFYKSVEAPRVKLEKNNKKLDILEPTLKQKIKWFIADGLREKFNLKDIPYGSHEEYDYFKSLLVSSVLEGGIKNGKLKFRMNALSNDLITKDMNKSPDFTKNFKKISTPPVLVAHPEFGVVPWQIHYQYKDYFKNTQFLTVSEADHGIWDTKSARDLLIKNSNALFHHQTIPDEYIKKDNPYPVQN